MFVVDLVATIPWEEVVDLTASNFRTPRIGTAFRQSRVVRIFRLIRLLRLVKLLRFVRRVKRAIPIPVLARLGMFLELTKFTSALTVLLHWITCWWYFIGKQLPPDELRSSPFWLVNMYFSVNAAFL